LLSGLRSRKHAELFDEMIHFIQSLYWVILLCCD